MKPCRVVTGWVLTTAVIWSSTAATAQTRVEYDVEFSVPGTLLQSNAGHCPTAGGMDKLTGTLWGYEPAPAGENTMYYGKLTRFTDVNVCEVRTLPPGDRHEPCSVNIQGRAIVPVEFEVLEGSREAYLQAKDTGVIVSFSDVQGDCDPADMAQWQADYGTMSTAGSPDGQPVEVAGLPPASIPFTFPPNPPRSIWTLKVLARRP